MYGAPLPKFYYTLAKKIVEVTEKVQLHLKHIYMGNENMERVTREELISSRNHQE